MISIIVPVYNVEKYISRCIDSILAQTYKDWELILVDDGSPDNAGRICDEYALNDKRIHIFHKENGGVSSARNLALEHINGDWVTFIDSDDWVEENYLQNYVDVISDEVQLVVQGFILDTGDLATYTLPKLSNLGKTDIVMLLEKTRGVNNGYLWHKLIKSDIIRLHHILFNEIISLAEDGLFFFNCLQYVEHINTSVRAAYHYVIRNDSLTSRLKIIPAEQYGIVLYGVMDVAYYFKDGLDSDNSKYKQFIRRFCWRLMNTWLLDKALHNDKTAQQLILNIIERYHLGQIEEIYDSIIISLIKRTKFRKIAILLLILKCHNLYIRMYNKFRS